MARSTSSALNTELAKHQNKPIELLDIFFGSQTADDASTLHYAMGTDVPVAFFNIDGTSKTYTPLPVSRSEVTNVLDTETRQVTLQMENITRTFQSYFFQGADFMRDKRVVLRHIDLSAVASASDAVLIFDATIATVRITERVCQLELAGAIGNLNFQTGRKLDRLCPLVFAGSLCAAGVSAATLLQSTTDTVTGASTKTSLVFSTINKANKYYAIGTVIGVTGQNIGVVRKVITWTQSSKTAVLDFALPFTPANGDQFTIKRDCDKTFDECKTRYTEIDATVGNTANFHGFPTVVDSVNP